MRASMPRGGTRSTLKVPVKSIDASSKASARDNAQSQHESNQDGTTEHAKSKQTAKRRKTIDKSKLNIEKSTESDHPGD